jgi:hypothetical protein
MATLADLQSRISAVRSKERTVVILSGTFKSVVTLVAVVLVYFLVDWVFDLPYGARLLFAGLGLATFAYVVYQHLIRELQRIQDDDEIALRVEARNSELKGRLISSLQLSRGSKAGNYVGSAELLAALEDETIRMSEPLDFFKIINMETVMRFGVAAVMVIVIKGALLARFPDYFQALGLRLVKPNAHFPTKCKIKEIKVVQFVPRGEDLPVEVIVDETGDIPTQSGTLFFQSVGKDSSVPVELVPAGGTSFKGVLTKALDDVNLTVKLGDAFTDPMLVRVLPRPEVDVAASGNAIEYALPVYTNDKDKHAEKFGGLSSLIGSKAKVRFTPTKPLKSAQIDRADGTVIALTKSIEKRTVKEGEKTIQKDVEWWEAGDIAIDKNGSFHVSLVDVDGLKNSQPAVEYPIDARADNAPTIKLLKPSRDMTITPMAKLNVQFSARDDWGIRTVWLVYRVQTEGQSDGTGETKRIERQVPHEKVLNQVTFVWDVAAMQPKVGEQLIFWLEADDDCTTNDNIAASRSRRMPDQDASAAGKSYSRSSDVKLTIVSREDKLLELQAEVERLYQQLLHTKDNQEELKTKVRILLEEMLKLKQN